MRIYSHRPFFNYTPSFHIMEAKVKMRFISSPYTRTKRG